jgi:tRNA threonylcarbamoyl adenosine modification protein YjeE
MSYFDSLSKKIKDWVNLQPSTAWVFLYGDLGAGKTTFAGEVLAELGFNRADVQSPTFLKVISYKNKSGDVALHMDGYRVEDVAEFLRLGLEDYFADVKNVKVGIVEWPQKFEEFLSEYPAFVETLDVKTIVKIELPSGNILEPGSSE